MNDNSNKSVNDSGWVLCPSNTFPGKLYYFNVVTGEAVWGLNAEKTNLRNENPKFNVPKIFDSNHGYPEPTSHPRTLAQTPERSTNIFKANTPSSNVWHDLPQRNYTQDTPTFGQAAQFVPSLGPCMPMNNMVWMPVQMPAPNWPYMANCPKTPSRDQDTQTSIAGSDVIVQKCSIPLSQRFKSYRNQAKAAIYGQSSPIQPNNKVNKTERQNFYSNTDIESNVTKSTEKINLIRKSNMEVPSKSGAGIRKPIVYNEEEIVSPCNKVKISKSESTMTSKDMDTQRNLSSSDLRLFLTAKRKKLQNEPDSIEKKKPKLQTTHREPKKRVTFDLEDSASNSTDSLNQNNYIQKDPRLQNKSYSPLFIAKNTFENTANFTLAKNTPAESTPLNTTQTWRNITNTLQSTTQSIVDVTLDDNTLAKNALRNTTTSSKTFPNIFLNTTQNTDDLTLADNTPQNTTHKTLRNTIQYSTQNTADSMLTETTPAENTTHKWPTVKKTFQNTGQNTENFTADNTPHTTRKWLTPKNIFQYTTQNTSDLTQAENTPQIQWETLKNTANLTLADNTSPENATHSWKTVKNTIQNTANLTLDGNPQAKNTSQTTTQRWQTLKRSFQNTVDLTQAENTPPDNTRYNWKTLKNTTQNTADFTLAENTSAENTPQITTHSWKTLKNTADLTLAENTPPQRQTHIASTSFNQVNKKLTILSEAKETSPDIMKKGFHVLDDICYIVADMDVLLNEYDFIEELLQSDDQYRLLVPHKLRMDIDSMCVGDCRGQKTIIVARQISRRLSTTNNKYIAQPAVECDRAIEDMSLNILNSCARAMKDNMYLILVTNNQSLINKANMLQIPCYKTQSIKNGDITNPKLFSYSKKVKNSKINKKAEDKNVINNNDNNMYSNLNNINVDTYKKQLISDENTKNDLFINITKPKGNNNQNVTENITINKEKNIIKTVTFSPPIKQSKIITMTNKSKINLNNSENKINFNKETVHSNIINKITSKSKCYLDRNTNENNNSEINETSLNHPSISQWTSTAGHRLPLNILRDPVPSSSIGVHQNLNNDSEVNDTVKIFNMSKPLPNKMTYLRIKAKMEEWICMYHQIMEELMNDILQKNGEIRKHISSNSLQVSLLCIKMLHSDSELGDIVELLLELLTPKSCQKGTLQMNTNPYKFMKIIGYSVLLVQRLKIVLPTMEVLNDYEYSFEMLLENMKSAKNEKTSTDVCPSEYTETNKETGLNHFKEPSSRLDTLKRNFKEWKTFDESEQSLSKKKPEEFKVVRITGKNLNMLKIDNNKSMSFTQTKEDSLQNKNDTKLIKYIDNKIENNDKREEISQYKEIIQDQNRMAKNLNQNLELAKSAVPNNTKNIIVIDDEEIKLKEPLDLDVLDYSETYTEENISELFFSKNEKSNKNENESNSTESTVILEQITNSKNCNENFGKNCSKNSDDFGKMNDFETNSLANNDSTNDSGFENDSTQAYTLIKMFLNELSTTFKIIYEFIVNFVEEIREEVMYEERKNSFHIKASMCLQNMVAVIQELKSIIKRETEKDSELKKLLLRAGVSAKTDTKITKYRQIVRKCLEQAQILESALRITVCITIEDFEAISINPDSITSSIRYLNIFEQD